MRLRRPVACCPVPAVATLVACTLSLAACGGSGGGNGPPDPVVSVTVTPGADTVTTGLTASFDAAVSGTSNGAVAWAARGGAGAGTVSPAGLYTAGGTTGVRWVVATSVADPDAADSAEVLVVGAPVATITAPASASQGTAGLVASVPAQAGVTYAWTIVGGVITAGAGTRQVTFTAGAGATAQLGCTVTNLAGTTAQGAATVTLAAGPVITSFTADRAAVTFGQKAVLTAVFAEGTGEIAPGVGPVTSGVPVEVTPLAATTDYLLTVTGTGGATVTATVQVAGFSPPGISRFDAITRAIPPGATALFAVNASDAEGSTVLAPSPGALGNTTAGVTTAPLGSTTLFTLTVTNPADSVLTDTATVEVLAPAAGSFAPHGALGFGRGTPALARLPDGRVLVVGGLAAPAGSSTAEIWDPGTGDVTPAGASGVVGIGVAVEMVDGTILVAGSGIIEVYDPLAGTFTFADSLEGIESVGQAIRLADGRVVLAAHPGLPPASLIVFDPGTAAVTSLTATGVSLPTRIQAMRELPGGVLAVGGAHGAALSPAVVVVDLASGLASDLPSSAVPRSGGRFAVLGDGRFILFGGTRPGLEWENVPEAESLDPVSGVWTSAGVMAIPRSSEQAVTAADGRVLVLGGSAGIAVNVNTGLLTRTDVFDPVLGRFLPGPVLDTWHRDGSLLALPDGRVVSVGGSDGFGTPVLAISVFE